MMAEDGHQIRLELAIMVDAGTPICQVTYALEGDGILITEAFDHLETLRLFIDAHEYPNLQAGLRTMDVLEPQRLKYECAALECVLHMFNSLRTHILNDDALLHGLLQLCKAARVLSPIKYRHMSLLNKDLSGLARVLSGEEIAAMKQEEPSYAQAAHQYDVNGDQSTGILQ
jgi:hypothetical protein